MTHLFYLTLCALLLSACKKEAESNRAHTFRHDVIIPYTPVKNQGRDRTCWAYAMLSTVESNNMAQGDSVNLSVNYAIRHLIEEHYTQHYLTKGQSRITAGATAQTLLNLTDKYGMVSYKAYPIPKKGTRKTHEKALKLSQTALEEKQGMEIGKLQLLLDEGLGKLPQTVSHKGVTYSPRTFADAFNLSADDYEALTSFTHHPFFTEFALEVPDNWEQNRFYNLPIDSLMTRMEEAVRNGESVCWEGDTSESSYSFSQGVAEWKPDSLHTSSQAERQKMFESFQTTDDHAMSIVGIAYDEEQCPYFIMKNSWGKGNRYGGLMYVSFEYVRMKTIAVWVKRHTPDNKRQSK